MAVGEVVFVTNDTKKSCLGAHIRVADKGWDRIVGLLKRRSLDQGAGLLIVPTQAVHTFGMAFAIDLVFVDKRFKVIGVRENMRPYRISRVFWRAFGVFELPTGTVKDTQTAIGDQIRLTDSHTGQSITA